MPRIKELTLFEVEEEVERPRRVSVWQLQQREKDIDEFWESVLTLTGDMDETRESLSLFSYINELTFMNKPTRAQLKAMGDIFRKLSEYQRNGRKNKNKGKVPETTRTRIDDQDGAALRGVIGASQDCR